MYILYLDDSGAVENVSEKYFVLAGVALFERHIFHLNKALDAVAADTGLADPETLEFHGVDVFSGNKRWRPIRGKDRRAQVILDALGAARTLKGDWRLFGVVVEKAALLTREPPCEPVEFAFSQILSRFDQFLARTRAEDRQQRGLVIIDEHTKSARHGGERMSTEQKLKELAGKYRRDGHSWGKTRWLIEAPLFMDSRLTRAVQYADLVAYALRRHFEKGDSRFFDEIKDKFDTYGGVVHGLLHERYADSDCDCPYCLTRRR